MNGYMRKPAFLDVTFQYLLPVLFNVHRIPPSSSISDTFPTLSFATAHVNPQHLKDPECPIINVVTFVRIFLRTYLSNLLNISFQYHF